MNIVQIQCHQLLLLKWQNVYLSTDLVQIVYLQNKNKVLSWTEEKILTKAYIIFTNCTGIRKASVSWGLYQQTTWRAAPPPTLLQSTSDLNEIRQAQSGFLLTGALVQSGLPSGEPVEGAQSLTDEVKDALELNSPERPRRGQVLMDPNRIYSIYYPSWMHTSENLWEW